MSIQKGDILEIGILNEIHLARILPDTTHADSMGVVTPHVLHKDVARVGFGRETVISDVDSGIGDTEPVHDVGIKAVGVRRVDLFSVRPAQTHPQTRSHTEALVEYAWIYTSSKEMSLVRTKKFVQQGEFSCVIPSTLTRVALSVKNKIGR